MLTRFGRPRLDCPLEFSGWVATLVAVAQPPVFHSVNRREFLTRGITLAASCALALRPRAQGAETAGIAGRAFQESAEIFPNPERGFYVRRRSDRMDRLESLRAQGISLLLVTFDLREFRERALTAEKLAELREMIREMELLHATYLNIGNHPRVLQLWRETEHRGENTFAHIARRLGGDPKRARSNCAACYRCPPVFRAARIGSGCGSPIPRNGCATTAVTRFDWPIRISPRRLAAGTSSPGT
ncbi:MAG: hypothetical protein HY736_22220 [Verrucomicrobia bacterium]|nr:hypothetical protein [Verrucomicrobiota bacterium]